MENDDLNISDKEFIKRYIPFAALKKAGFFSKDIKRSDHGEIVKRFLYYFGQTKREYILSEPTFNLEVCPGVITGHMPYTVDEKGELQKNGFKLSL